MNSSLEARGPTGAIFVMDGRIGRLIEWVILLFIELDVGFGDIARRMY